MTAVVSDRNRSCAVPVLAPVRSIPVPLTGYVLVPGRPDETPTDASSAIE
jgi:hypothetical protein